MKKLKDSGGMIWHIVGSYIFSSILAAIATTILAAILSIQLMGTENAIITEIVEGVKMALGIEESTLLIQLTLSNVVGMILTGLLVGLFILLIFAKLAGWKKYCVSKADVQKIVKTTWTIAIIFILVLLIGNNYNVFAFMLAWGINLTLLLAVTYDSLINLLIFYILINKIIKPTLEANSLEENEIPNSENNNSY